jgi:tetratricopeptide (TPR) repeat protein
MKRFWFSCLGVLVFSACLFGADSVPDLLNAGRADEAIRVLNGKIAANPKDAEAYNQLCRAYYFQENYDPAIANCERAVQLDPESSSYHMWLGRTYGDKADKAGPFAAFGLARKAVAQFERAVQLDPKNVPARADLAEFYGSAPGIVGGGDDKAVRMAEETAKIDPAAAANMRAQLALSKKDFGTAVREAQSAVQLSGGTARYLLELARIYSKEKHWDEMESTIQKAMALPNKKPQNVFFAAELLIQNGRNLDGGIQLLRSYLAGPTDEQGPTYRAYYLIGKAYEKLGNKAEAAKAYGSALQLASGYRRAEEGLKHLKG